MAIKIVDIVPVRGIEVGQKSTGWPDGIEREIVSIHPSRGRPLTEDRSQSIEARKPWLALGIKRRAWYYRKAKEAPK